MYLIISIFVYIAIYMILMYKYTLIGQADLNDVHLNINPQMRMCFGYILAYGSLVQQC